ncbi:glycosyltransferase family 4 protein [Hydrogenophaga sp.]|uniref:glycosyltransferase family 4 protein n=1 Tax=Hydrogenophaga sp. TaxID=1904254 RepID=UPI003D12EBA0
MKRIAFFMQANQHEWLGGLSYLRNLLKAVLANPGRRIEPVLMVHPAMAQTDLSGFPAVEVIRTPLVMHRHPARLASRVVFDLCQRDITLELLLRKHRIDALSHAPAIGTRSTVPSIGWIPDFQHIRMSEYFTQRERDERDRQYLRLTNGSHRLILSSNDARQDFTSFAPHAIDKARVLHFVASPDSTAAALTREHIASRFGIDRPYFHLPNQFWTHKNHAVVIEAVGLLRKQGVDSLVLATGKASDHRDPQHYERLMARVKQLGIEDSFRALGVVSLPELQSLMLHALALINPSNFEGWSTTVEESKSLGLPMILSDIPVHQEQAPDLGRFFKSGSAEALAEAMRSAMRTHDPVLAKQARKMAAQRLPERMVQFGRTYEAIALDAISNAARPKDSRT